MNAFGLEDAPPLFEPHNFKGVPGVIGGNCVICHGPLVEPWHQTVRPISEAVDAARSHDCIGTHHLHGAPGEHWKCPDCGENWVAESAGPLDIRWGRQ